MFNNLVMDTFRELAEESFSSLGIKGEIVKTSKTLSVSKYRFDKEGETRLKGTYYTVNYKKREFGKKSFAKELSESIKGVLSSLISKIKKPLVVGLGNSFITSDALGSQTINALIDKNSDSNVMLFKPSVYGLTKIESSDVIKGLVSVVSPDCIIAVDTLCCLNEDRLYSSVQISDAGIIPGVGLGNPRTPLTKQTLSIPVISIGIPLISYSSDNLNPDSCVTPKEIDVVVKICAKILADGIFDFIKKR